MIYPIDTDEAGKLLLVSTKLGNVSGSNGEVVLSKVIFRVIGEGKEAELLFLA